MYISLQVAWTRALLTFSSLRDLQSQEVRLRTAHSVGIVSVLPIEGVAAVIQGIYLRSALVLPVAVFGQAV